MHVIISKPLTLTRLNDEREVGANLSLAVLGTADVLPCVSYFYCADTQHILARIKPDHNTQHNSQVA